MSESIKELVKRLRDIDHMSVEDCFLQSPYFRKAADALEAMAGENERLNVLIGPALEAAVSPLRKYIGELQELNKAAEAERDRLAGEVERLKALLSDNSAVLEYAKVSQAATEAAEAERDRLAGEVERVTKERDVSWVERKIWISGFNEQEVRADAAEAERDRLKAALEQITAEAPKSSPEMGDDYGGNFDDAWSGGWDNGFNAAANIARKALGGDA